MESENGKTMKVLEVQDQTILYVKLPGVWSGDPRRKRFFHPSGPEMGFIF